MRDEILKRLRFRQAETEQWIGQIYRDRGDGWPAVNLTDETGSWTTAQFMRVLAVAGSASIGEMSGAMRTVIGRQSKSGGWPLISGADASTISTGETVLALQAVRQKGMFGAFRTEVEDALESGIKWLYLSQNRQDGGWGLEAARDQSGESRLFSTIQSLLALADVSTDQASAAKQAGTKFLASCRTPSGRWATHPGGPEVAALTPMAIFALLTLSSSDVTLDEAVELLNGLCQATLSRTLSIPVSEEEVHRSTGVVRIFHPSDYWAVRCVIDHGVAYAGLPSVLNYLQGHDEPSYRLECLVTGQRWAPVCWITALMYEVVAGLAQQFTNYGMGILTKSAAAMAGVQVGRRFDSDDLHDQATDEPSLARIAQLLAGEPLAPRAAFVDRLAHAFRVVVPDVATSISNELESSLLRRYRDMRQIEELELPDRDSSEWENVPPWLRSRATVSAAIDALATGRLEDARILLSRDAPRDPMDHSVWDNLLALAECLRNVVGNSSPSMVGRELSAARELIAALRQSVTGDYGNPFNSQRIAMLSALIERYERQHSDSESLLVEWSGTLREGEESPITLQLRTLISPLRRVLLRGLSTNSIKYPTRVVEGSVRGYGVFEATIQAVPMAAGSQIVTFEVEYETVMGRRTQTLMKDMIVQASATTAARNWTPIKYRYEYGPYVSDQTRLIGREVLLEDVVEKLSSTRQPIAVTGQWRIGKSTFMRQVGSAMRERDRAYYFCSVDLQLLPVSATEFSQALLDSAMAALTESRWSRSIGGLTRAWERVRAAFDSLQSVSIPVGIGIGVGVEKRDKATGDFEAVRKAIAGFKVIDAGLAVSGENLLISVDEINRIADFDFPDAGLALLRGLVQQSERIRFLVGSYDIFAPFRRYRDVFFNVFQRVQLTGIDRADVVRLLALAGERLELADSAIDLLHRETGGSPYWLSVVCDLLIKRANIRRRGDLDAADVRWALDEGLRQQGEVFLQEWNDASDEGDGCADVLRHIAALRGPAEIESIRRAMSLAEPPETLDRNALRRLVEKGLVRRNETDSYQLSVPLFGQWLRQWEL